MTSRLIRSPVRHTRELFSALTDVDHLQGLFSPLETGWKPLSSLDLPTEENLDDDKIDAQLKDVNKLYDRYSICCSKQQARLERRMIRASSATDRKLFLTIIILKPSWFHSMQVNP